MQKYIKENLNKILSIFILLQPILDLLTGLCTNIFNINLTVGIVIRVLFLIFIMYITTFIYKKKLSLYTYIVILIYSLLYLIGIIIYKDKVVFAELQGLVKTFYFPLILISLYDLKEEFHISKLTLFTTLFLYLILILIPNALGIGFQSYQITKSGSLGFFNSANEISGIISILTPLIFVVLKDLNNKIVKILFSIIYIIVILTIGTKTPLLTLFITIGMAFIYYIVACAKKKTYKPIIYTALLIMIGISSLLLIIPKTNFYKNIKVHLDYLEVDNVFEIFKDKELIDHFIFSQRLTFLENKSELYEEASIYENLFGIGYTKNGKTTKLVEMDYFDILYSHGIIGFIIFFGTYSLVLYKVCKDKQKLTFENYMQKLSVLLILLLSLFTGHIITGPAVALIAITLILDLAKRKKKSLLFTAVNFEIGGIETALINLLNNIDYKKYKVDVILEENKGILLSRVNQNVKISELKVNNNTNIFIRKGINFFRKLAFTILNYNKYDFSCCYATYSLSGNKLALIASKNNSIYVHSDYKYVYKTDQEVLDFFNQRNIEKFKTIFFVSNQARDSFIELYGNLKSKCQVYNNFINVDTILKKSQEKLDVKVPSDKKVLLFVGRLDDNSKKLSRAINLVKEIKDINLWIVGDGPDRKMYEDLVNKNNLDKRITNKNKKENPYPYMVKSDYVILTSDYEGFPVTYLEAIVLNKPIITTIDVSDDKLDIGKDHASIISKDEKKMVQEVKKIIKEKPSIKELDFKQIQKERMKKMEAIFNEVK